MYSVLSPGNNNKNTSDSGKVNRFSTCTAHIPVFYADLEYTISYSKHEIASYVLTSMITNAGRFYRSASEGESPKVTVV